MVLAPGETEERDLSWFDASQPAALSRDGRTLLFTDRGAAGSLQDAGNAASYLRRTDGSPAIRLGEGTAQALSPDGQVGALPRTGYAAAAHAPADGTRRAEADSAGRHQRAGVPTFFRTGRRFSSGAAHPAERDRVFVQDLEGRERRALPEGFHLFRYGSTVSPDGKQVAAAGPGQKLVLIPIDGGEPRPVPGALTWEAPVGLEQRRAVPLRLRVADRAAASRSTGSTSRAVAGSCGRRSSPATPPAFGGFTNITFTPDRKSYAYNFHRHLCTLYLVEGLK